MKILTYVLAIFLIFGLLGAPSSVFAQEQSSTGTNTVLQHSDSTFLSNNFIPILKGGSRASKKVHSGDDDDTSDTGDSSTDDGSGWWIAIIIMIIIIAIIILAVWYFFLRK
jgi:ABC-type transport system involved in multi-copper enzyme maturation permease subunit